MNITDEKARSIIEALVRCWADQHEQEIESIKITKKGE